ncbi:MAG: serine/threonine protein kinase [Acidobacteriaceae bacterium]|nr:serine/threonine protein kinase [Acidobacteriaceae bacterium]
MALSVGERVENYLVIGLIGAGGMGTVYKVQHVISDRIEAMKAILPDLLDTSEAAERFVREIKVQARLSHPNIASLHNALQFENQFFMVMEYIEGTTLHARLRQGRLEPGVSIDIALQILSALAYAHSEGVVHRDIKPANVMLTNTGMAKVMDFGIARSLNDKQLTRAGAAVGSLYYMSPEQVQGGTVDARSDLYSVGIVLYEMLTGIKPITGDTSWAVMNAHINQVPKSAIEFNPGLPPALCEIVARALQKPPQNRFQTASEFAEALKSIRGLPLSSSVSRLPMPSLQETQVSPAGAVLFQAPPAQLSPFVPGLPRSVTREPSIPTPATPGSASAVSQARFDQPGLERLTHELAAHVGPMARVLVNRAAKKAQTWRQLYEMLAAEVPAGEERKRFLAKRPLSL